MANQHTKDLTYTLRPELTDSTDKRSFKSLSNENITKTMTSVRFQPHLTEAQYHSVYHKFRFHTGRYLNPGYHFRSGQAVRLSSADVCLSCTQVLSHTSGPLHLLGSEIPPWL